MNFWLDRGIFFLVYRLFDSTFPYFIKGYFVETRLTIAIEIHENKCYSLSMWEFIQRWNIIHVDFFAGAVSADGALFKRIRWRSVAIFNCRIRWICSSSNRCFDSFNARIRLRKSCSDLRNWRFSFWMATLRSYKNCSASYENQSKIVG